jgi:hypothetical protein
MKVWVAKRRDGGTLLGSPIPFGDTPAPFELLVVEVTDQGARRPGRVARLIPAGGRVAIAQLAAPRLVWCRGWDFVLSGVEERSGEGGIRETAQSWVCRLASPRYAAGFLARHTHKDGLGLKRGAMFDRYASSTKGQLTLVSAHDDALGRQAMRADLSRQDDPRRSLASTLVDVDLAWMSEERFALTGFELRPAYEERPARLLRQGWLCEFNVEEPEDDRPRRKNGALR